MNWLANCNAGLDAPVGTPGDSNDSTLYGHALKNVTNGLAALAGYTGGYAPKLEWGPMLRTSKSLDPHNPGNNSTTDNLLYVASAA